MPPTPSVSLSCSAVWHMARPGEHDVLEQVREAGAADDFVLRSDLVPDVHRHGRRRLSGDRITVKPFGSVRFQREGAGVADGAAARVACGCADNTAVCVAVAAAISTAAAIVA